MSSPEKLPRRVAQACDACRRRKVRCGGNGEQRCQPCEQHDLQCIYSLSSAAASSRSRIGAVDRGAVIAAYKSGALSPARSISLVSPPATADTNLDEFYNLIPKYMARVYPVSPIVGEEELRFYIEQFHASSEAAALVYAFAGATMGVVRVDNPPGPHEEEQVSAMVARALERHTLIGVNSRPTILRILASLFIEHCMFCLHKLELGFFYLREAITLLQMLHLESTEDLEPPEKARRQRLYWECFIHERYIALHLSLPICLDPLPFLPDPDPTISSDVERGWNHIIKTFLAVDRDFVRYWAGDRSGITASWIQQKHDALTDDSWQLGVESLPMAQQADLIITRQWLRTITWQMAISSILMSSNAASSEALSLTMPIRLSSQLRQFLGRTSLDDVTAHGWAIVEKLFEITNTISDVVVFSRTVNDPDETRRMIDDVLFAKSFLYRLRWIKPIYKEVLEEKLREIRRLHGAYFESLDV